MTSGRRNQYREKARNLHRIHSRGNRGDRDRDRITNGKALRGLQRRLERRRLTEVRVRELDGVLFLEGMAPDWDSRIWAGHTAAKTAQQAGLRGVVNEIKAAGVSEVEMRQPAVRDLALEDEIYDLVIIGGGITGCAVARELSRFDLRIAVLEKEEDVGVHTSSRNDGMIHPGFAPKPGSKRAYYNTRGNTLYTQASRELGFTLKRPGSILLFHSPLLRFLVPLFKLRCRKNGVAGGYRYLNHREVALREPHVLRRQYGGFFMPSAGIVNPFEVTIAYAENAAANGVSFHFSTVVLGFDFQGAGENRKITEVRTNRGTVRTGAVINAAGNWADRIAQLAADRFFSLHGRRGADLILDRRLSGSQHHILGMPYLLGGRKSNSKGGGLVPCVEGNLLAGPTARETPDREGYATTREELEELNRHIELNTAASATDVITYFAGVRPATWHEDFIIERSARVANLIHLAGIQSPGLASAPAIAEEAVRMVRELYNNSDGLRKKAGFNPYRRQTVRPAQLPRTERMALIQRRQEYGRIICRCEEVSEGEIRDALRSPLRPESVDAVKRRTRAGAGRCHGGFCLPRVMEIIADERGIPLTGVRKKGNGAWIVAAETKERVNSAVNAGADAAIGGTHEPQQC